ncbi:SDR family NAD(P)-dependent oxidoreductase [Janthinobacterium sp. RB2R34]|uniref:SDR family NAD(P)-dependent oxidoreductase n=1 Tax=Janthinobacterium sp. RB2R34 TaxID=3424193 RepID=UPI003F1F0AD1
MSFTSTPATVIAVTPSHRLVPEIAIAAQRAGAIGLLDLGPGLQDGSENLQQRRAGAALALASLAHACAGKPAWGVRWEVSTDPEDEAQRLDVLVALLAEAPDGTAGGVPLLPVLLLAGVEADQLAGVLGQARAVAGMVLLEVRDLEAGQAAEAAGYDGLIVKGHEAGGRVSPRTSFILLQELAGQLAIPYWIQGGIGLHTGAAAMLSGAAGVVLCEQLWLAAEGPYGAQPERQAMSRLDGSETMLAGSGDHQTRLFSRAGRALLRRIELAQAAGLPLRPLLEAGLIAGAAGDADGLLAIGQDIALAAPWAGRYGTVGRMVAAVGASLSGCLALAQVQAALAPDGPLARTHGTVYPIAQGPMTRVSDLGAFARAVADGGALPFLALAVMRGPQVQAMLRQTSDLLGARPWGVGVLGFLPLEMRQEQMTAIRELRPPFAVIAGGRPSQARELEALGIVTYLHVPSPGLLHNFVTEGARHFVFEGSECGGHTGPRSSFALWEQMLETLMAADISDPQTLRIMFAGGIHDALSAAMVAALAAPLVARGAQIGIWMGTAYLFTEEIVSSGAIVAEFQRQAIECSETALLQSGVGVYTRCARTPFCAEFDKVRQQMMLSSGSEEETLLALETMNIGRLRIAAKGVTRNTDPHTAGQQRYVALDSETQRREGVYMLGDVARLRAHTCTIAALHEDVAAGAVRVLQSARASEPVPEPRREQQDIAIVGMACLFPGAQSLREYWENIVRGVDSVREVDAERWSALQMFDPKRGTPDKVYAKWGGFLDDIAFDPQRYGIAPASLASIEPMQLLALEVARQAMADASLDTLPFARERTSCVFAVGGMADLSCQYNFRTLLPLYLQQVDGLAPETREQILSTLNREALPQWSEDTFPGILGNVVAGRIANRLDLGGTNFTVDAACAASLAAVDIGIRQLRAGQADVALVGGADCTNGPIGFMCFSQTHALSPRGRSRPFDRSADGIAISEGVGAVVLKRLADAERDGDRIYALIKGTGSSSDGRNRSLTAPHPAGQVLALKRAYQDAGVAPSQLGLIEAHGTGTALGDKSELRALAAAFGEAGLAPHSCALGSVKSMIGHAKVAAGMAGLIKAALALEQRVLPPTIGIEQPTDAIDFSSSPFYLNTEARPWLAAGPSQRHCGVSAFGFGGTNFHAVLAEYQDGYRAGGVPGLAPREVELFAIAGASGEQVALHVRRLLGLLEHARQADLAPLAWALYREQQAAAPAEGGRSCRLALLAGSVDELRARLAHALELMPRHAEIRQPPGLYYRDDAGAGGGAGAVCFLFPGQGSQRVNMLRDLVLGMPALHGCFNDERIAGLIYPPPVFGEAQREAQQHALNATEVAQPALGMAGMAGFDLLATYGLAPDMVAGHSYGEYVALCAAGAISRAELLHLSLVRGRLAQAAPPGAMAVLDGDGEQVAAAIGRHGLQVAIANLNSPVQTIIAGGAAAIDAAIAALSADGMRVRKLPVSAAFHCSNMDHASQELAQELAAVRFRAPALPVYSNTTASPHAADADELRRLLARHIAEPVRFVEQIEALYQAGARTFIECGPGLVLAGLVGAILGPRPHDTLALDAPGRPGWLQLGQLLAQAVSLGLPVNLNAWYAGRGLEHATLDQLAAVAAARTRPAPLAWRVNGGRAQPWHAAAPAKAAPAPTVAVPTSAPSPVLLPAALPDAGSAIASRHHHALPTALHRRSHMNAEEFRPHYPPEPQPGASSAGAALPLSEFSLIQHGLARLLDLQCEQQLSLRHFLDFQARMAGVGHEPPSAPAYAEPSAPAPAASVPMPEPKRKPETVAAAPRPPVLPKQLSAMAPAPAPVPAPPPPPPPVLAPAAAGRPVLAVASAAEFKTELVKAVSERTGYPVEMLDLDAHMEADLGIDSIKRIEILSGLTNRYDMIGSRDEEAVIAELSGYKTLNEIANWYARSLETPVAEGGAPGDIAPKKAPAPLPLQLEAVEPVAADAADPVRRYVVHASFAGTAGAAVPPDLPRIFPVLLAGAQSALAQALRQELERLGYTVLQLIPAAVTRRLDAQRCEIDLSSLQALADWRALAGHGRAPIGMLLNLMGADESPDDAHLGDARAMFLMLKLFEADLKASAAAGAGWLLNLTRLDGQFGLSHTRELAVGSAGTLGVAKSAAREWPTVKIKCVDAEPGLEAAPLALRILGEIGHADTATEIGLTGQGRWNISLRADGPPRQALAGLALAPGAVLLVTGGAYGITADIASALAAKYRPTLVLVGRSALPGDEDDRTRGIDGLALQQVLIAQLCAGDAGITPARVNAALKRIVRERAIRTNLAAMRASGATVEYHCLDVRDGAGLGALVDDLYQRHGRIDGVLHGAGVIGDKLIADKTLESFDAVFDTKVLPALVLARKLRPESLKFIAFFSSVAGRFGNVGQCDYSAANEVLNKLADSLGQRWPKVHALSINWGPWDAGMVDDGLRKLYALRDIVPIPVADGRRHFLQEVERGAGGEPELVITSSMQQIAALRLVH